MFDWLIVGGGIHGTYISNFLLKFGFSTEEKLAVVDPHPQPVQQWKERTANVSMRFLRSPGEHHLDVGSRALIRYARSMPAGGAELYSHYQRPSLRIFNRHCDAVINENNLSAFRHQGKASRLVKKNGSFILSTDNGAEFETKNLILSIGCTELSTPAWSVPLICADAPISHVFSPRFTQQKESAWSQGVVVGTGISAVQLALGLVKDYGKPVTLVHSKPIRTYQFDADPCWILDGGCLPSLSRQTDDLKRRNIVNNGRHWGSVPEDIKRQLMWSVKNHRLTCIEATTSSASAAQGTVSLTLSNGVQLESDLVVLASGFSRAIPGGKFIADAIDSLQLQCAPCGFPRVDKCLQWSQNLFVTGPMAELEVGPASRNIVGARLAAEKIVKSQIKPRLALREHHYAYFARRRNN